MTQNNTQTENRQSSPYIPSWEVTRNEIPGWLRKQAERLDKRAIRATSVNEILRDLGTAEKARNAAEWYAKNGGAL